MVLLKDAKGLYVGGAPAKAVYAGTVKVWPTDLSAIPGLTLWVEADDHPATVDSDITSAPSRVGPNLVGKAMLRVNKTGGRKVFDLNPGYTSDQGLDAVDITLGPDFTVFVVVNATVQPVLHAVLLDFHHGGGTSTGGWVIQQDFSGPNNIFAWHKGSYHIATAPPYPGVPCIVEAYKKGDYGKITIGTASAEVTGEAGMDSIRDTLRIGNYVSSVSEYRTFLGHVSMVAGWNRALDPAELAQARSYLSKWGV